MSSISDLSSREFDLIERVSEHFYEKLEGFYDTLFSQDSEASKIAVLDAARKPFEELKNLWIEYKTVRNKLFEAVAVEVQKGNFSEATEATCALEEDLNTWENLIVGMENQISCIEAKREELKAIEALYNRLEKLLQAKITFCSEIVQPSKDDNTTHEEEIKIYLMVHKDFEKLEALWKKYSNEDLENLFGTEKFNDIATFISKVGKKLKVSKAITEFAAAEQILKAQNSSLWDRQISSKGAIVTLSPKEYAVKLLREKFKIGKRDAVALVEQAGFRIHQPVKLLGEVI